MDGYAVVAALTAAFVQRLQSAIAASGGPVSHALVTADRPSNADVKGPRVNVFLYHAEPSAALRNDDLATRTAAGALVTTPRVPFDLYYLLTFYGADLQTRDAQMLFGLCNGTIAAFPSFSAADIAAHWDGGDPDSISATVPEPIRFVPHDLSIDAMSRLWAMFPQVPYGFSTVLRGSTVIVPANVTGPAALPVRRMSNGRGRGVGPMPRPPIVRTAGAIDPGQPLTAGGVLLITGGGLDLPGLLVGIGGLQIVPSEISATRVIVPLPPDTPVGIGLPLVLLATEKGKDAGHATQFTTASFPAPSITITPSFTFVSNLIAVGDPIDVRATPTPTALAGLALFLDEPTGDGTGTSITASELSEGIARFPSGKLTPGKYVGRLSMRGMGPQGGSVTSIPDWTVSNAFTGFTEPALKILPQATALPLGPTREGASP